MARSSDGVLEDLIAKAGFDTFWAMVRNFAGFKSMIGAVGEEKIHAAALTGAKPSINDTGELWFNNAYRLVIARE